MKISYYKEKPSWNQTIYVVGLPRSGKSTVFNIIGSCKNVESSEEPFELLTLAQKASCFSSNSITYESYLDSYMANMENLFSELILGRSYNFREEDKSCIFNLKSHDEIQHKHKNLLRRSDVIKTVSNNPYSFLIAFNDIEQSLHFITQSVPNPVLIHTKRDCHEVANEIAEKGWLTDEQLSTQANLAPAYRIKHKYKDKTIYVPYLIPTQSVKLFLSLDNYNRSLMFSFIQDYLLNKALKKYKNLIIEISYNQLMKAPNSVVSKLLKNLRLESTEITNKNLSIIKESIVKKINVNNVINKSLKQFMSSFILEK